jgi:hypothetical protein
VKRAWAIVAALCAFSATAVWSQMPSGKDVVAPSAFASADPAARNKPFQIAVVMKIRPGFHVNAREKSEDYLIATDLKLDLPAGFTAGEVVYPKGTLHTFAFTKDKPLNIYEGSVTLRVPVTASSAVPLGPQHIPLKLHYQACSNEACLPPATLPVDAVVNIAASGAKPAHAEIFSPH